ncbi:MAG TPA: DUF6600 domain-containing protein [Telluria sp.]
MRIPRLALKTLTLLTFAALSTLAAAQDEAPGQVGRIALTQGSVSIGNDTDPEMAPAQLNWPVTSGTMITTAPGARTELRIGSTSIRLDGDTTLEVTRLDDSNMRLRLHYGSASVRVLNPDVLAGFELDTPQAQVRLQQPSSVRVDAERVQDTSAVEVFEGMALVDGGGSELSLRAGKGAELTADDVRTMLAQADAFDDWSLARDQADDNASAARYVGTDMTGYEDLDSYGSWTTDTDYGPLWTPVVSTGWVPYSDGSWVWLDPWGWTWVDDEPWGYAPFHYGRWVYLHDRWSWAPGRRHDRPVWAPALVGWVGGSGWNVTLRDRSTRPATGWYPLTPHDRYVPGYRASAAEVRGMNADVRPDPHRARDVRPQGLTLVPQARFAQPGRVDVAHAPRATPAAVLGRSATVATSASAPPPPPNRMQRDERAVRTPARDGFNRQAPLVLTAPSVASQPLQGLGVNSPTPHLPSQGLGVTSPTPHLPSQGLGVTSPTPRQMAQPPIAGDSSVQVPGGWRHDEYRERQTLQAPAPVAQPAQVAPQAAFEGRAQRAARGEWERPREVEAPVQIAPRSMPAPVMAAPRPAPAPQQRAAEQRGGGEQHARSEQRQQER